MELQLFTVYDSAAGMYLEPFFAPSAEAAIRGFRQAVNTENHSFNSFPEDFTLFSLGSFDSRTGMVVPHSPVSLGVAITFVERLSPENFIPPVAMPERQEDPKVTPDA